MEQIVAICGLECSSCPAYIARLKNDDVLRKKTAAEWSKTFGAEINPEDINCVGCIAADGVHIGHCSECEIRKCGFTKNVKNCAYCDEYICERMEKWFKNVPDAKKRLEQIRAQKQKK